ncbi:MAG: DedA family protein [Coriobacteriia bacterium]|nr:DedA family protein [Coriobacteriia bacterium]
MPATGFAPLDWFLGLLDVWGHLIVVGFTVSENLFVIGSFTPGETVVMAAGFVSEMGGLNPWLVGLSSLVGTMTGSNLSYWFGRHGGRNALIKWGGKFFDEERIIAAEEYFELHGNKTVLVSRFAAGFKNFVPVIAGASRMRVWIFELYTLFGAVIYTTLMVMLGRIFADNFDRALAIARNITWFGLFLLLAMFAAIIWGRRKYIARRVEVFADLAEELREGEPEDGE